MPYVTVYKKDYRWITRVYGKPKCCSYDTACKDTHGFVTLTRIDTSFNATSSRPVTWPPEENYLHPTGLNVQYRKKHLYGVLQSEERLLSAGNCSGGNPDTYKKYSDSYLTVAPYATPVGTYGDPDWTLPMRLKIRDTSVNLGSNLAEYRESVGLVAKSVKNIYRTYKDMRKGRFGNLKRRFGNLCNVPAGVLTWNWGVAPMINDIENTKAALERALSEPLVRRFVVTVRDEKSGKNGNIDWNTTISRRAIVYATLDPNVWTNIDLGNPLENAWELIPFSVIVDYIWSFGDWLSSLDALRGVSGITGTLTTKTWYRHVEPTKLDAYKSSAYKRHYTFGLPRLYYDTHRRDLITAIPVPPLPEYRPSDSLKKLANAFSLLAVVSRGCNQSHPRHRNNWWESKST